MLPHFRKTFYFSYLSSANVLDFYHQLLARRQHRQQGGNTPGNGVYLRKQPNVADVATILSKDLVNHTKELIGGIGRWRQHGNTGNTDDDGENDHDE